MRMPGVEPGSQAWGACMMPLHYMRSCVFFIRWSLHAEQMNTSRGAKRALFANFYFAHTFARIRADARAHTRTHTDIAANAPTRTAYQI